MATTPHTPRTTRGRRGPDGPTGDDGGTGSARPRARPTPQHAGTDGDGGQGAFPWERTDVGARPQGVLFDPEVERELGVGEFRGMEFLHVRARSIINRLDRSIGLPFSHTINAYRGCSHACMYCFARPTHAYLGLGIGEDFDRRVVVKTNAVELLRAELSPRRWAGHAIAMGTNTDPYQRCEGKYRLTRGIIGVLGEYANPFSVLTKSTLVLRDLDVLAAAARRTHVRVDLSVGTLDPDVWRLTEPGTPPPARRLRAVRQLNEAGIPCGVLVAPILPGLSDADEQIEAVVAAAAEAGARSIAHTTLHLRGQVRDHVLAELAGCRPDLAERYDREYRRGSAPKSVRDRIARSFGRARATHAASIGERWEPGPEPATPVEAPTPRPTTHQLTLGLP
ncbi:MAG: radical SAM protein [Actinomycetota bacterium]|nr:radical SAM protein [Actinomycetota bacterium]